MSPVAIAHVGRFAAVAAFRRPWDTARQTSPPFGRLEEPGRGRATFGRFAEESTRSMTLLLAAVGAVVTALLELTVGPYLRIGTRNPPRCSVLACRDDRVGSKRLVWAFVGGSASMSWHNATRVDRVRAAALRRGRVALARSFAACDRSSRSAASSSQHRYSMILFVAFGASARPLPVADPRRTVLPERDL
jgi:hypothetical protein